MGDARTMMLESPHFDSEINTSYFNLKDEVKLESILERWKMSKEMSKEEGVKALLEAMANIALFWGTTHNQTQLSACNGVVFSTLSMLDGSSTGLPAFSLHPQPHPEDKQYSQENGQDWWGESAINDNVYLHEMWSKFQLENPNPGRADMFHRMMSQAEIAGAIAHVNCLDEPDKKNAYKNAYLNHISENFDLLFPGL